MTDLTPAMAGGQGPHGATRGPRVTPSLALPVPEDRRSGGVAASLLIHAIIILVLVGPISMNERTVFMEIPRGAGGPTAAGGGGGGHQGSGGVPEQVAFLQPVATRTVAMLSAPRPVVAAPATDRPALPPALPPVLAPIHLPVDKITIDDATGSALPSVAVGSGGGMGIDASIGAGPGSAGGVGSGVGVGHGSDNGPGTGGGVQREYPPAPTTLFDAPMPVPRGIRGLTVNATFDVDSTGRVLTVEFTHTGNRDYDKKLEAAFSAFVFRPATRQDGTPIRMKFTASYSF
ncbi:MAG TPA: hypothetical protein VMH39_08695 [Gemmatimonadaceae bacterium]|nr:hypothetical protein [Gemmatimonadaceae bacterium]